MTPPPDVGEEQHKPDDDPLGGMDPMAWLESLARRQGANPDELLTSADQDIPLPSPEETRPETTPAPGGEPVPAEQAPEPVAEQPVSEDDMLGGMDPMAWLESLARRQGASPDELLTSADLDIPTPEVEAESTPAAEPTAALEAESFVPETSDVDMQAWLDELEQVAEVGEPVAEPAADVDEADLLGGVDPMAWLESLARRQGVDPGELTTAADLDIPLPATDAVVEEPGYSDYDPFSLSQVGGAKHEPPSAPEPVAEGTGGEDPLAGIDDPLAWLESLAVRQGADPAELVTRGRAGQPEEPVAEGEAEAPEFEPVELMSTSEAAALLGMDSGGEAEAAAEPATSWLESLASTEDLDTATLLEDTGPVPAVSDEDRATLFAAPIEAGDAAMEPESAMAWLEELAGGEAEPAPVEPGAEMPSGVALEGGLSDDPQELQAWLEAQARSLEEARQVLEEEPVVEVDTPAVAGEIPEWLLESMPGDLEAAAAEQPALSDEIPLPGVPGDLPPWLAEASAELDVSLDLDFETELLAPEPPLAEAAEEPQSALTPEELEALTQPASAEEIDSWAEALDEEYDRRQAGDESIPDWYLEALQRAETTPLDAAPSPEAVVSEAPEPEEAPLIVPSAGAAEMPDWLRSMAPEEEDAGLQEAMPEGMPDWLTDKSLETELAEPEAVAPIEPPPIAAEPVAEPPPEVVEVPAPAPAPEPVVAPTPARPQLAAVLNEARQMVTGGQVVPALDRYQSLIDAAVLLEETRGDLRSLAERHPDEPKVFRLLGDAHMRLGDLQAALDTYLQALNQL